MADQYALHRAAVGLAKRLGWPLEDVPPAFALDQVENYIQTATEALRQKGEEKKRGK